MKMLITLSVAVLCLMPQVCHADATQVSANGSAALLQSQSPEHSQSTAMLNIAKLRIMGTLEINQYHHLRALASISPHSGDAVGSNIDDNNGKVNYINPVWFYLLKLGVLVTILVWEQKDKSSFQGTI